MTQSFDLGNNKLSGTIPTQLAQLTKFLGFFNLAYNTLTGRIPSELGQQEGCTSKQESCTGTTRNAPTLDARKPDA